MLHGNLLAMAWKEGFGPKKGSSRLSGLVADLRTESLTSNREVESVSIQGHNPRDSVEVETAGLDSDEEEVLDMISEDEDDL